MSKKVVFFHTTLATPVLMKKEFHKYYSDVQLITILDDGILPEVIANNNTPTPSVVKHLIEYGAIAQEQGASVFVCICTTLGFVVREAQKALSIPMITIDEAMLKEAVRTGERIGILITFPPTAKTTKAAALEFAKECNRDYVSVEIIEVEGARDALNNDNKDLHDKLIIKTAKEIAKNYDVLVFAQVTMASAAMQCKDLGIPVLTSVESGILQLSKYLD